MNTLPATPAPVVGLGMTALVVGTVSLMFSIFPVLGIPLAALGFVFGIVGLFFALPRGGPELRWSLAGIGMCATSLTVNLAITFAAGTHALTPDVPQSWQEVPNRPYVPPPR
jgi:hypothetical protein